MNTIRIMLVCLLLTCEYKAQLGKGSQMLTPSIGWTFSGNNSKSPGSGISHNDHGYGLGISVSYSRFIKDKVALGLFAGYNGGYSVDTDQSAMLGTRKTSYTSTYARNGYNTGVMGRLYFATNNSKLVFFGQLTLDYEYTKTTEQNSYSDTLVTSSSKNSGSRMGANLRLNPGLVYFANQHVGIELLFGDLFHVGVYESKSKSGGISGSTESGVTYDSRLFLNPLGFSIGINFYF